MTLAELIAAVREEVHDPAAMRWQDATIRRYLNAGQEQLARASARLRMWEAPVAAGKASVIMPADFMFLYEATWETDADKWLLDIRYGQPRTRPSERGEPGAVHCIDGAFVFDIAPSSPGTLMISGIARPLKMTAGTDGPGVEDADDELIAYAVHQCLLSDGDPLAMARKMEWEAKRREWAVADARKTPMPRSL